MNPWTDWQRRVRFTKAAVAERTRCFELGHDPFACPGHDGKAAFTYVAPKEKPPTITNCGRFTDAAGVKHEYWFVYPVPKSLDFTGTEVSGYVSRGKASGDVGVCGVMVLLALSGSSWRPVQLSPYGQVVADARNGGQLTLRFAEAA